MCLTFLPAPCSHLLKSISVLAWDSISQRAAQERMWGCHTLLNCCPGRSLLTVMWEASAAPWALWQTGLQCWGVCQGCFFHKAFYKSVTAPCLPFPPCTHALLSQQAPKELLRNAEPTHKPAQLATLVILFLARSSTFLSCVPSLVLNHGRLRLPRRGEQERRCLFGAWS